MFCRKKNFQRKTDSPLARPRRKAYSLWECLRKEREKKQSGGGKKNHENRCKRVLWKLRWHWPRDEWHSGKEEGGNEKKRRIKKEIDTLNSPLFMNKWKERGEKSSKSGHFWVQCRAERRFLRRASQKSRPKRGKNRAVRTENGAERECSIKCVKD